METQQQKTDRLRHQEEMKSEKELSKKAREFRKERIFAIVNEFQKSRQMVNMVITLDWLFTAWEECASDLSKKEFEEQYSYENIRKIRQLLFSLDHLNSRNYSRKMYENQDFS